MFTAVLYFMDAGKLCIAILLCLPARLFAQPVADFTASHHRQCPGITVQLHNTSTGADSYEWFVDNTHYSYAQDTVLEWISNGIKAVKLAATNTATNQSNMATDYVEMLGTSSLFLTGSFALAVGDTATMTVYPEAISVSRTFSHPVTIISGCASCPSVSFILLHTGTYVEWEETYNGGCTKKGAVEYVGGGFTNSIASPRKDLLQLFPNPAGKILYVRSDRPIAYITIQDMAGRSVVKKTGDCNELDISSLAGGLYFLKVTLAGGEVIQHKFSKY